MGESTWLDIALRISSGPRLHNHSRSKRNSGLNLKHVLYALIGAGLYVALRGDLPILRKPFQANGAITMTFSISFNLYWRHSGRHTNSGSGIEAQTVVLRSTVTSAGSN